MTLTYDVRGRGSRWRDAFGRWAKGDYRWEVVFYRGPKYGNVEVRTTVSAKDHDEAEDRAIEKVQNATPEGYSEFFENVDLLTGRHAASRRIGHAESYKGVRFFRHGTPDPTKGTDEDPTKEWKA